MAYPNEVRRFGKSFKHALRGLRYALKTERNFQIELIISIAVVAAIIILDLKNWQAVILIFMIMWVLVMELINTVVERVVDMLKPGIHPYARLIKDIMAAVVLISAIVAVGVGAIIFLPYFKMLI